MSTWICRGCGREATHIRTIVESDQLIDQCEWPDCGNLSMVDSGIPDVYLSRSGQTFNNLSDEMGKPIAIQSKRHKKQVMDSLGVSEAGGTVNGARFGTKTWIDGTRDYRRKQFEKDRPKLREIYKNWKEKSRASR